MYDAALPSYPFLMMSLPPSGEEQELLHDFGGHEPEDGDTLLVALREERTHAPDSLIAQEERRYNESVRAFFAKNAEGAD